jgi:RND superfamily putative drug exporter
MPPSLAERVVRHPRVVALLWLAGLALLVPRAVGLADRLDVAARVRGSESERVDSILQVDFGSPFTAYAVLVMTGVPLPSRPEGRALLDSTVTRIAAVEGVTTVRAWQGPGDTLLVDSAGGAVLVVVGLDPTAAAADRIVRSLRAATAAQAVRVRPRHSEAAWRWTGQSVLNRDLRDVSARSARVAEARALPVTLVLLAVAFGGILAAAIPIVAGVVVIAGALGIAGWLADWWSLSLLVQTFVTMVGLGLGIDYALLVVARFRDARAGGSTSHDAAVAAARYCGHTVALSALAVAVGLVGLATVPVTELRSVAVGGVAAAALAALFAMTLLPALLGVMGDRLDLGRIALLRRRSTEAAWIRWSAWVTRNPRRVFAAALLPMLALSAPALRLRLGLPEGSDWLPRRAESVQALRTLEASGRDAWLHALRVLVELPPGRDALTPEGWAALRRVRTALAADPRVGAVWSFAPLEAARPPSRLALLAVPENVRRAYLSADRRQVLLEAIPRAHVEPTALVDLAREVRARVPAELDALPGTRILVGGLPALRADYDTAIGSRFALVAVLVLAGTFVALLAGFRSVVIPLKAIALNLLSVGAGFGAMVLVFQDAAGLGEVFAFVPVLVFCTVFGLSMDYEVFLLTRVAEGRARGLDDSAAVAEGLAGAAPVITSAAAVMVTVFGAFVLADQIAVRMLGLALAVAVFVDATIVRVALGPALVVLAGRWNWWPGARR